MTAYSTVSEAGFVEYHEARGREIPGTWDTDRINAALLVASEWLDNNYGPLFIGEKTAGFLQEREWPRMNAIVYTTPYYVFPTDAIPLQVTNAVYEIAFREATLPGSLNVDYKPNKYSKVSIDGAVSVEWNGFNYASEIQLQISGINSLLAPLLEPSGTSSALSGASERV